MRILFVSRSMLLLSLCIANIADAQNVGINTNTPERTLEVEGSGDQFIRVLTTNSTTGAAGIELVNGLNNVSARDWKIENDGGAFRIVTNDDNFSSGGSQILDITAQGAIGLHATNANSRLQIGAGEDATATGDGFLLIGSKTGVNLVADQNEINARNNGSPYTLSLQPSGGSTFIGNTGGNIYFGDDGLSIGTTLSLAKVAIESSDFQMQLSNTDNEWYVGASNQDWTVGPNRFLFSPSSASDDAVFRLHNVSDNDGAVSPVSIRSSASQTLLIDGNEFDGLSDAIYINHNSNEETYINPSGGYVGIGTTSPDSEFHITTPADEYALILQRDDVNWAIHPYPVIDRLAFLHNEDMIGQINGANGQWISLSDRNAKEDIIPLAGIMDKVNSLGLYSYSFKHDLQHTRQIGVIAQEIETLFPEVVHVSEDQYKVAYAQLSVIAVKALQEQQLEIDALQQEIFEFLNLIDTK